MPRRPPGTDWRQILALYDRLMAHAPTPVGRSTEPSPWPRSEAQRRPWPWSTSLTCPDTTCSTPLGPTCSAGWGAYAEAADAYDAALALSNNAAERGFLGQRREVVSAGRTAPAPPEQLRS